MRRPQSIIGQLLKLGFLADFRVRAIIFGFALLISGVLVFFPERFTASSTFTPSDRNALGLSGALGQLDAVQSVFSNQAAVEIALRLGASDSVRDKVIANSSLKDQLEDEGRIGLQRFLSERVDVRSLRGGIVLIEMQDRDPDFAREIVGAFQTAMQEELGEISRKQTQYKREILDELVQNASEELDAAQRAYDNFRLNNRYANPGASIAVLSGRVSILDDQIRSREIELEQALELFTPEHISIKQKQAELRALRRQFAQARSTSPDQTQGVGELVQNTVELDRLSRELGIAKSLYNNYLRFLRGTTVEDLTAEANLRLVEQPHVETERQYWLPAVASFILFLLLWGAIEAYRLYPPSVGLKPGHSAKDQT